MYVINGRTARSVATRVVIAGAATATVCAYCAGFGGPPIQRTAAVVNTATIVSSPTTIGIADSDLYGMSEADIDQTLDTLQSIGVQDIRVLVPWALVEPTDGTYNWSLMDEVVDAAAARNMGVLADVTSTPTWDAPAGTIIGAGTPNPTDYASFLTQVAKRYGSDISSYEIWNEPNYAPSYDPIDPATYTALLKAGYTAIKAVDPQATVIAAGLGAGYTFGNLTMNPVTFVQDMLADGASGYFDALAFHPYEESLEFSQGAGVSGSPLDQLNSIEQLLAANGDAAAKIWVTEYGLPTSDVSQQTQATYIQNFIDTWQTLSYAGPAFIYTAQDGTSTDPTGTYGIYNANWTPKLAVAVLQAEIAKYATAAVVTPVVTVAQQLSAYQQAVANALQAFAQQVAQALANAAAAWAAAAATPAPAATTATATTATTPSVKTLAVAATTAATPAASTTPQVKTPRLRMALAKGTVDTASTSATPTSTTSDVTAADVKGPADPSSTPKPSSESASASAAGSTSGSTSGSSGGSSGGSSTKPNHPAKPRITHTRDGHPHDGATSHGSS